MAMTFAEILKNPHVKTQSPCESKELDELSILLKVPIPERLIEFWRSSNGAVFTGHDASILGISEVAELLSLDGLGDWLLHAGFLPFVYDQESNYLCVAVNPPLSPRVVYILHDDSPKILYRDVDALFKGCLELLASKDFAGLYFHESDGDYGPDAARTPDDLATAKYLTKSNDDWAISMAIQLLDSSCTDQWHELLNGDRFARQDALARLQSMSSVAVKMILDRDANDFAAFADDVCHALTLAEMSYERRDTAIRVNQSWMDLNAFFGRRHIDNAMPRLVKWFIDVHDGKTPTDHPGHYMVD